jgi:hypothetical protein
MDAYSTQPSTIYGRKLSANAAAAANKNGGRVEPKCHQDQETLAERACHQRQPTEIAARMQATRPQFSAYLRALRLGAV